MKATVVSIIVPVFNGSEFIQATLKSLSDQSYPNLDIIVVNDCSTDDTASLVTSYQRLDKRIRMVEMKERSGVHRARIQGLSLTHGEYVCFLDSDDLMPKNAIEQLLSSSLHGDTDVVIGGIRFLSEQGIPGRYKLRFPTSRIYEQEILSQFCSLNFGTGSLCNKIYRREILKPFLQDFGELISINEDYLVNFGVFLKAKRISLLSDVVYLYRQHKLSTTADVERSQFFVKMLRAYVVCLETYGHLGSEVRSAIDTLYKKQLQFQAYTLSDPKTLDEHTEDLAETMSRLVHSHPEGVYQLCHAFDCKEESSDRKLLKKQLMSFFKNLFDSCCEKLCK